MSLKSEVEFSFNFLLHLNASKETIIYSPSSLLHLLSMIYAGADGNTAQQIEDVIGNDKSREEIIKYYSDFIKRHKQQESVNLHTNEEEVIPKKKRKTEDEDDDNEPVKIHVANKLFIQEGLNILPDFQKIIQEDYKSDLEKVNFKDNVVTVEKINTFVKDATKYMIPDILSPDDIDAQTKSAIINAVYFNGLWEQAFDKREKKKFYSNPEREIDFMTIELEGDGDWNITEGEEWKALGIPYKNRKAWMFIVLPEKEDGLEEMIKKADYKFFEDVTERAEIDRIIVTIPLINISTSIDLPEYLEKMGITDAFDERCDFSKMCDQKLVLGKAIHKTAIKVNEYGTEATAATIGAKRAMSHPERFVATHPFLYFIVSTENSETITPKDILFVGTFC